MMDNKDFKTMFGNLAKAYDFNRAFGGWFKKSDECIVVLELQKSSYSNAYYLNVKIFIQGTFGITYSITKELINRPLGNVSEQITDLDILDLEDNSLSDEQREDKLNKLFCDYVVPFTDQSLSKEGIIKLAKEGRIYLTLAVKEELNL